MLLLGQMGGNYYLPKCYCLWRSHGMMVLLPVKDVSVIMSNHFSDSFLLYIYIHIVSFPGN